MRICLIYDRRSGGLPKMMLLVASLLSKQGSQVLACGPLSHHQEWKTDAMQHGVEVFEMNSHRVVLHDGPTKKAVAAFRPDIVVSAHRGCDVRTARLCRKLKVPHVIGLHGNPMSRVDVQYPGIPGLAVRNFLWKRAIDQSALVICCSRWVATGLTTGFGVPTDRIRVIYNGILLEQYTATPRKRLPRLRGQRSYSILSVGRLSREKNPHFFVDLVAELRAEGIGVEGTWLGDGPLREEINQYASQRGVGGLVRFLGDVQSPQAFYHETDVLAHFRVDEAFGLVLAEAQAAGLPIVAFRAGAVPEVVDDGVVGLLCEQGDISEMASLVKRIFDDPGLYLRMSTEGARLARERYSAERMGQEYRSAFRTVLAG